MLEDLLKKQSKLFCTTEEIDNITDEELQNFKKNVLVVLPAGGRGTRLQNVTMGDINKVMIRPSDKTLIEMCIEMYSKAGLKNFLVLIAFKGEKLKEYLGDGKDFGVNISYSKEPGLLGTGGAILNALLNDAFDKKKTIIVHNSDDIIYGFKGSFPDQILKAHLSGLKNGCIATAVCAPGMNHQFSAMLIENNVVTDFTMYPFIYLPTHIGISILDPKIYPYFEKMINEEGIPRFSFEETIMPGLSKEKKLYSTLIPNENWFIVNDLKGLEKLKEAMGIKDEND